MDEAEQPRVLANKVILQLIHHMVSEKLSPTWEEYQSIRVLFRHRGGSWAALVDGDPVQLGLLCGIVKAWGDLPARKLDLKRIV